MMMHGGPGAAAAAGGPPADLAVPVASWRRRGGPGAGARAGPPLTPSGAGEVGRQRPSPEEMQRRMRHAAAGAVRDATFDDYKKVDGIMLPHKINLSLDGEPNEEWTIEKFKVNPHDQGGTWEKK